MLLFHSLQRSFSKLGRGVQKTLRIHAHQAHSLREVSSKTELHHFLGMVIVVAHASEIGRVVSHLDWFDLALAGIVFLLWQISQPPKEKEI